MQRRIAVSKHSFTPGAVKGLPHEEFDEKLEEFEQERERKAKEALKALRKTRTK